VKARDHTCRTPGCPRPAVFCDADHLVSWPAGSTSEQNLCSQCRHDHRLKHEGRRHHELSSDPDHPPGTVLITTVTGHAYLSLPHDYRPLRPSILPDLEPGDRSPSPTPAAGGRESGGVRFAASDWLCLNPLPDDGSEPSQRGRPDPGPLPF
jgi:hypothetical protein